MTIVAAPARVLVTGANGFLAVWIVQALLKEGYTVLGTVRSKEKGEHLKKLFDSYGRKFDYTIVTDVTEDGAFDHAVKEVEAVLHTAAPSTWVGTYDTIVKPALNGTLSILKSIVDHGKEIRRVVLTSSIAAIMEVPHDPGTAYTEADWNDHAVREVQEKGEDAGGNMLYFAAKTLSERAAWDFVADHKGHIGWDFVALLPSFVIGPSLQEEPAFSQTLVYQTLFAEQSANQLAQDMTPWIDVRDVALAHVLALQKQEAGGERVLLAASSFGVQDILDAVAPLGLQGVPKGYPEVKRVRMPVHIEKAAKVLGLTHFTSLEESAQDTVKAVRIHLNKA